MRKGGVGPVRPAMHGCRELEQILEAPLAQPGIPGWFLLFQGQLIGSITNENTTEGLGRSYGPSQDWRPRSLIGLLSRSSRVS